MKKLLLALLVLIGLQTQAQINYCDSIEINLVSSSAWCNLETNIPSLGISGLVEYDWTLVDPTANWNWAGWDSTATPNFWLQPNTTTTNVNSLYYNDTLLICLTVIITDSIGWGGVMTTNCYNSCEDTLIWDGGQWNLLSMMQQQTTPIWNYCDSIEYITSLNTGNPILDLGGLISGSLNDITDTVEFTWTVCAGGLCYSATGPYVTFPQVMTYDTASVCMSAYTITNNVTDTVCIQCDSLVWDGLSWVQLSVNSPTSINELTFNKINNNKIYDLLGRELNEIPVGTMYIRNNKLYITK